MSPEATMKFAVSCSKIWNWHFVGFNQSDAAEKNNSFYFVA